MRKENEDLMLQKGIKREISVVQRSGKFEMLKKTKKKHLGNSQRPSKQPAVRSFTSFGRTNTSLQSGLCPPNIMGMAA